MAVKPWDCGGISGRKRGLLTLLHFCKGPEKHGSWGWCSTIVTKPTHGRSGGLHDDLPKSWATFERLSALALLGLPFIQFGSGAPEKGVGNYLHSLPGCPPMAPEESERGSGCNDKAKEEAPAVEWGRSHLPEAGGAAEEGCERKT